MRGFWLVKPDGLLSESGTYFHEMWTRWQEARGEARNRKRKLRITKSRKSVEIAPANAMHHS
jgi:hypothetical protein